MADFKNNFKNDLQLSALFKEASVRAANNPHNAYTKACANAVESACAISHELNSKGFAHQASALRNLADAMNLAAEGKVKSEKFSAAFASASGLQSTTTKDVTQALQKAFVGVQHASSRTKETFIKAYRDFKAQPTEAKMQDLAVTTAALIVIGAPVSPLLIAAVIEHVASVIAAELSTAGASGPIACSWQAIAEDVSNSFQAPAVIQPSIMATHAQTIQSGANAVASAAQSTTAAAQPQLTMFGNHQPPAQPATGVQAPSAGASATRPLDYGHSAIQYEQLKDALNKEQFTSIIKCSKHGIERLVERGFQPSEIHDLVSIPDVVKVQADGAKIFIKAINDNKYNLVIYNETTQQLVTALRNISKESLTNLGNNYGWKL